MSSHSITGIHLGLAVGKKAFIIFDPKNHKIHKSCNVHFFEGSSDSEQVTIEAPHIESHSHVVQRDDDVDGSRDGDEVETNEGLQDDGAGGVDAEVTSGGIEAPVEPHRSGCVRRAPIQDNDTRYSKSSYNRVNQLEDQDNEPVGASYAYMAHDNIPCTYHDAMK